MSWSTSAAAPVITGRAARCSRWCTPSPRQTQQVQAAIAAIPEHAWTEIDYPDGGIAQVAETTLTASGWW